MAGFQVITEALVMQSESALLVNVDNDLMPSFLLNKRPIR
jgi:hypothetical protein